MEPRVAFARAPIHFAGASASASASASETYESGISLPPLGFVRHFA